MGMVYEHHRKNFPLRLNASERDRARAAAARMPPAKRPGSSFYSRQPWTEADYWRAVGLDWAEYVNAQPATDKPDAEMPREVVARLQARVAELETQLAAAQKARPTDAKRAVPTRKRKGRAA
jgi:hypothetical protein